MNFRAEGPIAMDLITQRTLCLKYLHSLCYVSKVVEAAIVHISIVVRAVQAVGKRHAVHDTVALHQQVSSLWCSIVGRTARRCAGRLCSMTTPQFPHSLEDAQAVGRRCRPGSQRPLCARPS